MMMKIDGLYVRSCYKRNDTSFDHAAVKGLHRVDEIGMAQKMVDIMVNHPMRSAFQVEYAPKKTSRMDRHGTTWLRGMVTSNTGATTTKKKTMANRGGRIEDGVVDKLPTGPSTSSLSCSLSAKTTMAL